MQTDIKEFLAIGIPGTEAALCDELRELEFASVRMNRGGIPFRGTWREGWRACLESRIAERAYVLMGRFPAANQAELYAGIGSIDWSPYITYRQTISVSAVCRGSALNHSGFVALKTKDAIVDQIREQEGKRPSVERDDPDVRIYVYVVSDKASVYLDLAGEALHRRGYRKRIGEAPIKETLAAAMLRLSGWDRKTPLVDPMCGAGTIAIEAAQWAANRAPGLLRERFGFQRWANFTAEDGLALKDLKGELYRKIRPQIPRIQATDADAASVEGAIENARLAGVRISIKQRDLGQLQGSDLRKCLISNPPYGVRMEVTEELYRELATIISRLHGWRVCLLAGSDEYERFISARPVRKIALPNGDIECQFLTYEID